MGLRRITRVRNFPLSTDHVGFKLGDLYHIIEPRKYYRALVRYDPQVQSPNEETADEELAFIESDILIVS